MKMFKRTLAMLLCAVMALGLMAVAASAAADAALIDKTAKGSITITKYESATKGSNGDGTNDPTIPEGATPLAGVTFTLYKVMDADDVVAYYNGTNTQKVTVDTYLENGAIKSGYPVSGTATTDTKGVAKFSNLEVGMYVVIETKYPDKVTIPCAPFLVSIPMTNPDEETAWMYDVNVYPKNATSEGNVILKKEGSGSQPIPGVVFQLYKQEGSNWIAEGTTQTTDANGEIRFSNLTPGGYKVIEISAPNGYIVDGRPTYFTVTENNTVLQSGVPAAVPQSRASFSGSGTKTLTITVPNYKPAIDKISRDRKYSAMPGQEIAFAITIRVPYNIADLKTFTLTDSMSPMVIAKDANGKDKIAVETAALTGNMTGLPTECYTVSLTSSRSVMTITFDPAKLASCAGQDIYVYYTANIKANTPGQGVYTNTAELTYTTKLNDDGQETDTGKLTDVEKIYNFDIDISKVAETSNGQALGGVEFMLYKADKTTPVSFYQHGVGSYFATTSTEDTTQTITTGTTGENLGKLNLSCLPAGTYYLKEIKTADGYNLLSDMIEINLNFTVDESSGTPVYKIGETTHPDNSVSVEVINKKGFTLPQTGGVGTLMFILIGGVLMAGGIVLLTNTGKKRAV